MMDRPNVTTAMDDETLQHSLLPDISPSEIRTTTALATHEKGVQ